MQLDSLVKGTWYDGFTWYRGKQQGVATGLWTGETFLLGGGDLEEFPHVDDAKNRSWSWSFEPNVVSIGEPAL